MASTERSQLAAAPPMFATGGGRVVGGPVSWDSLFCCTTFVAFLCLFLPQRNMFLKTPFLLKVQKLVAEFVVCTICRELMEMNGCGIDAILYLPFIFLFPNYFGICSKLCNLLEFNCMALSAYLFS